MSIAADSAGSKPESPTQLFFAMTTLALQGFGGVLAVTQRELVERRRWMTNAQFLEDWAVAQVLPGPNVVNLAVMLGDRHFGVRGALAAVAGMLAAPATLLLLVAVIYDQYGDHPAVAGALRGMGAVAAGLIGGMALKLGMALRTHQLGVVLVTLLVVATALAIGWLRIPLPWVLLVLGGASCFMTWRLLAPTPLEGAP